MSFGVFRTSDLLPSAAREPRSLKRVLISIGVTALCWVGATSCMSYESTLRYRLTVEVEKPGGVRTGSSVVEVGGYVSPSIPGPEAGGFRTKFRGEATPVRLDDGRYIFAIFRWVEPTAGIYQMLTNSFRDQLPPYDTDPERFDRAKGEHFRSLETVRGVRALKPQNYPVLATFANRLDPHSIQIAPAPDLPTILPGYRIRRMTVEITHAPVSTGLMNILPWLERRDLGFLNPAIVSGRPSDQPEYQKIQNDAFLAGYYK